MWTCQNCGRIFEKKEQMHSCQKVPLSVHFKNKESAKKLFNKLFDTVNSKIGKTAVVSLPCCIHLFGRYDFLAALPKKDKLEIRFALDRRLDSPRLSQSVPLSATLTKNCIELTAEKEIDSELIKWLEEAYHLKDEE